MGAGQREVPANHGPVGLAKLVWPSLHVYKPFKYNVASTYH